MPREWIDEDGFIYGATRSYVVDECGRFTRWMTPEDAAESLRQAGNAALEMAEEEEGTGSS